MKVKVSFLKRGHRLHRRIRATRWCAVVLIGPAPGRHSSAHERARDGVRCGLPRVAGVGGPRLVGQRCVRRTVRCLGEVYLVNLEPSQGTKANKTRPAIVVSNDAAN
ncbi:MAG: type II toxin-antitoxin system PemK/MazF family toxin, partial [Micromonosporaceae bacterium]